MKRFLSLLLVTVLCACSLQAQDFTADWQRAEAPQFTDFSAETTIYLWNIGYGGFYINHQDGTDSPYWGTRSSVNDTIGTRVRFTRTNPLSTEEEDWSEECFLDNTYLWTSYVTTKSAFYCTFTSLSSGVPVWSEVWTDNNT